MTPPLTDEQFIARLEELLREESDKPKQHWYLSFADDDRFLGGAIVYASGFVTARAYFSAWGINPGGECRGTPVPPDQVPPMAFQNRLLTREELTSIWGEMKKLSELEEGR